MEHTTIVINKPTITDDYGAVAQHNGRDDFCWGPAVDPRYGVWSQAAYGDSIAYCPATDPEWDWPAVLRDAERDGLAPIDAVYDYMTGETHPIDALLPDPDDDTDGAVWASLYG